MLSRWHLLICSLNTRTVSQASTFVMELLNFTAEIHWEELERTSQAQNVNVDDVRTLPQAQSTCGKRLCLLTSLWPTLRQVYLWHYRQQVAKPLATLAKRVATAALESSTCFQSPTVQGSAQTSVESSRAVGWMHERRLRRQKQGPLRVAPCFRKSLFLRRRAHFLIKRTFVTSTSYHKSKSYQAYHLFLFICKHAV